LLRLLPPPPGELVALIDALDMLMSSRRAAGADLERLLWIRGFVVANPGMCHDMNQRAMEQAVRALTLVLQAGTSGWSSSMSWMRPPRRCGVSRSTWLRLQRMVEGVRRSVCCWRRADARSSAGSRSFGDGGAGIGAGMGMRNRVAPRFAGRLFEGLDIHARVIERARCS
jgi:hypothetical protein